MTLSAVSVSTSGETASVRLPDQDTLPRAPPAVVTENISSGGAGMKTPSRLSRATRLSCNTDWGTGQLLLAVGTMSHTPKNCTKGSHCNRFDACKAPRAAPGSASVWSVPVWAVALVWLAPGWAVAPEWAQALVWATKAL